MACQGASSDVPAAHFEAMAREHPVDGRCDCLRRRGASVAWRAASLTVLLAAQFSSWTAAAAQTVRDCAACPEMVRVPGGDFLMGVTPDEEVNEGLGPEFRHRSEPQRRVTVRAFYAGKYEVTRAQYAAFAAQTGRPSDGCFFWNGADWEMDRARDWRDPGYPQGDRHPVACVSWEDATAYAAWLARTTGKPYRLLTEAEWEYAARAGTTTSRYWGDDPHQACAHANTGDARALFVVPHAINWPISNCDDGHAHTAPVGAFRPNAYGLHDMLGNVWEWTQDCWNTHYRGAPVDGSAWSAGDCTMRVVRGGSWDDGPPGVRAAYRVGSPVVVRVYGRGFRVAYTASGSDPGMAAAPGGTVASRLTVR